MATMETIVSPIHKWGLDPLFMAHRNVFVSILRQIVTIDRGGKYEFYIYNRPVKKVCVCGVLFEKIIRSKYDSDKVICKVDDGTGVVECIKFLNTPEDHAYATHLSVGAMVVVMGSIYLQNNEYVIQATSIEVIDDPNMESFIMLQTIQLNRDIYQQPYILNESDFCPSARCCTAPELIKTRLLYCNCCSGPASPWDDDEATLRMALLEVLLSWERDVSPLIINREKFTRNEATVVDIVKRNSVMIFNLQRRDACGHDCTLDCMNEQLDDASISQHIQELIQLLMSDGVLALQDEGDSVDNSYVLVTDRVLQGILQNEKRTQTNTDDLLEALVTAYPSIPHWRWRYCLREINMRPEIE